MKYQVDKQGLLDRMSVWDSFLKRKVHLIACGGTALTLLGVKPSTKDIDLIVPNLTEYNYLINILKELGYKSAAGWGWARGDGFIFDLFRGKRVHTTVDMEDSLALMKNKEKEIDINLLIERFHKAASVDVSEDKVNKNLEHFLKIIKKEDLK